MPTTNLYFVRHGETAYNRQRIMQGRGVDASLNTTGRVQAAALARRFANVPLDAIYTSTLARAEETAAFIARCHPDVPVYRLADLDEMSWGIYEGVPATSEEVSRVYEALYAHWDRGEFDHRVEGGESIHDVQQRGLRAIDHIMMREAGGTVLVVTHGRFLRVLLATLLESHGLERMKDIKHDNAAINHLVCRGTIYEAQLLNGTDHLSRVDAATK